MARYSHDSHDNAVPQPAPELSPKEVIRIQMEALQNNNDDNDNGIETAFQFASPSNRTFTGPLARFRQIIRNPAFAILLNHRSAEYDESVIRGDAAQQRVTINGRNAQVVIYTFLLSCQREGEYDGCWMTDGVSIDALFWLN
jgi:Domain of unknown function (DUF4864)